MAYSFKVEGAKVLIYLREKLLGSVALNGSGETVIEYSEGVMWLPVEQALERLSDAN